MSKAIELLVAAMLSVTGTIAHAAEEPIRIALTKKTFVMINDPNEVTPLAQQVADEVGEKIGREILVEAWDERAEGKAPAGLRAGQVGRITEYLRSGKARFVISDGLDFVRLKLGKLEGGGTCKPLDVRMLVGVDVPSDTKKDKRGHTRALVIVRKGSGIRNFADLKGKRLAYGPQAERDFSMTFLESLVRQSGVAKKEDFFGSVKRMCSDDASYICLLRKSVDVICITEELWLGKSLTEPAILNLTTKLCASDPYAAFVFFYLEGKVDKNLAQKMRKELLQVHETTKGRTVLKQFAVSQFVPIDEGDVKPIERLLRADDREDKDNDKNREEKRKDEQVPVKVSLWEVGRPRGGRKSPSPRSISTLFPTVGPDRRSGSPRHQHVHPSAL